MSMFRSHKDLQRTPSKNSFEIQPILYQCDICEEGQWMSETEVEIHRKTSHAKELEDIVTNKKRYGCVICARSQDDKASLIEHVKTEHLLSSSNAMRVEREIFICHHCTRIFFNKTLLIIHVAQKHYSSLSRNINLECPLCSKSLKKTTMWNHLEFHQITSVSTCPICLKKFRNRAELRTHLGSHRKYLFCYMCHYSTKFQQKFFEHIATHRKENLKANIEYQKFFVPTVHTIKRAQPLVHNPMKGLLLPQIMRVCVLCRHICTSTGQMRRHLVYDHTPNEVAKKKTYTCDVCSLEFSNNILLKQHIFKENHRISEDHDVVEIPKTIEEVVIESDSDAEMAQ